MVSFQDVSFSYGINNNSPKILSKLNYKFEENEIHVLFGPNGSGKTTILKLISNMLSPTNGTIKSELSNNSVCKYSYVFQNYKDTLLPWLSVKKNLEILEPNEERLGKLINTFNLESLANRYTYELSGGQQQILALARAFAYSSDIMLLDEPFSALDFNRSRKLWKIFIDLWESESTTTFLVSHSIEEAIFLAEKLHILSSTPVQIKETITLPFPKPGGLKWFGSEDYFKVRKKIENILGD